jgi:hypothetical protein
MGTGAAEFEIAKWFEFIFQISQIVLTVIAAIASVFAYFQVREARKSRDAQLKLMNATLLMELDHRWDAEEMREGRKLIYKTMENIKRQIIKNNQNISHQDQKIMEKEYWIAKLQSFRNRNIDDYTKIMRICGFFETVGVMVQQKYISPNDVISLFKGPILLLDHCFRGHIEARTKEQGVPAGLYEYALKLCDVAMKSD